MVVLKRGPAQELAYRFMDFLLEPENAAALAEYTHYATPVAKAIPSCPRRCGTTPWSSRRRRCALGLSTSKTSALTSSSTTRFGPRLRPTKPGARGAGRILGP